MPLRRTVGTSALLVNNLNTKTEGEGVSICPGPNMAYFSKKMSLKELVDHIYGRVNVITRNDRPNMFIKELKIYIDYLRNKIEETRTSVNVKQEKYLLGFAQHIKEGITYYADLFGGLKDMVEDKKNDILRELDASMRTLQLLNSDIENMLVVENVAF